VSDRVYFTFLRNKQGFIYSLISVFVLILIFFLMQNYVLQMQTADAEFLTYVKFTSHLEDYYLPRMTSVVANEGIVALTDYIFETNDSIQLGDEQMIFSRLFILGELPNGTIAPIPNLSSMVLDYESLVNTSKFMKIDLDVHNYSFSISQYDAWTLQVNVTYVYSLYSSPVDSDLIFANRTASTTVLIPIEGFTDPLFSFNGYGRNHTIVKSQFTFDATSYSSELLTNLSYHIGNETYSEYEYAPSFLARFSNDTSAGGIYGIESLVYPLAQGVEADGTILVSYSSVTFGNLSWDCESGIDYELFSLNYFSSNVNLNGFKLDRSRIIHYAGITDLYIDSHPDIELACPLTP
jgi:hypothetical protein